MGLLLLIAPAFPQFRAKGDKVNNKVGKAKKVGLKKWGALLFFPFLGALGRGYVTAALVCLYAS